MNNVLVYTIPAARRRSTSPCSASSGKAVTEWLQYFALLLTSSNHPEGSTLSMLEVTKKL